MTYSARLRKGKDFLRKKIMEKVPEEDLHAKRLFSSLCGEPAGLTANSVRDATTEAAVGFEKEKGMKHECRMTSIIL